MRRQIIKHDESVLMENKTKDVICCGFCHTELPKGVHVCKVCLATVKYGVPPTGLLFLVWLLSMVIGALIGMSSHSAPMGFIAFPLMGVGFLILKAIYSDRVVFLRR